MVTSLVDGIAAPHGRVMSLERVVPRLRRGGGVEAPRAASHTSIDSVAS